jgi:hypothetical protein
MKKYHIWISRKLVNVQMDGASWQGKTSEVFRSCHRLETYISNDRSDADGFSIQHNLIMIFP